MFVIQGLQSNCIQWSFFFVFLKLDFFCIAELCVTQYHCNVQRLEICLTSLIFQKRFPAFCICENKDADQLRGNREADQRLCFRYIDSAIPLVPKYEISSL